MSSVLTTAGRAVSSLMRGTRHGWVGVDVGARTTKLAQVEHHQGMWRWVGRWSIGHDEGTILTADLIKNGALAMQVSGIAGTRRMFRGRMAAFTLPTELVEIRGYELPTGPWHETLAMVEQELAADGQVSSPFEFGAWEAKAGKDVTNVIATAVDHDVIVQANHDLTDGGLDLAAMDVVPCALARAVSMCDPSADSEPVIALDFGYTNTLLTVVSEGKPQLCRKLRGCSLGAIVQLLRAKLELSEVEARQLLVRYGIPVDESEHSAADSIQQIVGRVLEQLVSEVHKTIQYASFQLRFAPKRAWLFGGGATIRNCAAYLTQQTGVATENWGLPGSIGRDTTEPLYGVAAGLSGLPLEALL